MAGRSPGHPRLVIPAKAGIQYAVPQATTDGGLLDCPVKPGNDKKGEAGPP
jgi:hypothetical protein